MPDKFAPPSEVVWQSPAPREKDPQAASLPYYDDESDSGREMTASEERLARNLVLAGRMPPPPAATSQKTRPLSVA